jgi:hypothetical protein
MPAPMVWVFLAGLALVAPALGGSVSGVELPERLTNEEFWSLTETLSEADGSFISDNLVSNEMSFAQSVPQLAAAIPPGGVYLGVGPEQNFTFLAAMRARIGFVVDIRRDNLLLHLMYKALFLRAETRCGFVSRLFSRSPACPANDSTARDLMNAVADAEPADAASFRRHANDLEAMLRDLLGLPLSDEDWLAIERMYAAFHHHGPDIGYATTLVGHPVGEATYANLMAQTDAAGRELGFLATEAGYRFVRDLQQRNLVVPVVGNFAGDKVIRAIASWLAERDAVVSAFYVSNVEDYLGLELIPANGEWRTFCANVATLPMTAASVFIRPMGLAAFGADGAARIADDMPVGFGDSTVLPEGASATFPSAIEPMLEGTRSCRGDS